MSNELFKFYYAGGYVRDSLLQRKAHDVDVVAVYLGPNHDTEDPNKVFDLLCDHLRGNNYIIYTAKREFVTIKAKHPTSSMIADYVLARKDVSYPEYSRYPVVTLGSLEDDIKRRDFTVNALVRDCETNKIIDLVGGEKDLEAKILQTPMDSRVTLLEDPLRVLRGFRFSIILGFTLSESFMQALEDPKIWNKLSTVVSMERIKTEMDQMLAYDTIATLRLLEKVSKIYPRANEVIFRRLNLKTIPLQQSQQ